MNLTTATIKELRAYCTAHRIDVKGDKRKRMTFVSAIENYLQELASRVKQSFKSFIEYLNWIVGRSAR